MKSVWTWGFSLALLATGGAPLVAQMSGGAGEEVAVQESEQPAEAQEPEGEATEAGGDPVFADELTVETTSDYVPTSNSIATKLPLPLAQTPASVGVVTGPLLEQQGARGLSRALENVSGVNVQTQTGVADVFVVRGFDNLTSALVLTDGAPEPEVSFYQLYNVDRVEVLKGPSGFVYGANPLAGTVNLVRKQPLPGSFLGVDTEAGSFGTYQGTVDWNTSGRDGEIAFRLNGLYRETDGWRDGRDGRVTGANPAFTWHPGEDRTLNLNYERLDSDFAPDAGLPVFFDGTSFRLAPVPRDRSYQSPFDRSEQTQDRFQADWESKVGGWTLRNKAYVRRLEWQSDGTLFNGVFPNQTGRLEVSRSLVLLDDEQEFWGDQLEGIFELAAGGVTHRLLAGVELARLTDRFTLDVAFLPGIDLVDPVETASEPLFLIPGQSTAGDARSQVVAPYVVDQMALSDKLTLVAGARFDAIDYEDDATATEREDREWSPMLGILYSPAAGVSLYASGGRAFAPPSTRVVGERRPEESNQVEAGVKTEFLGGRGRATLAVYQLERENMAIPDDNGITQQTGSQRSRGVEIDLAAEPAPRFHTFFSYAYNDAELTRFAETVLVGFFPPTFATIDRSGNRPAFAPEHIASLWLSQRLGGGLSLAGGARWVSEQFIAEDNAFAIGEALTLNAAVSWERGPLRWHLNLDNLTDEEYETRGFGSTSVIPAAGFAVRGGLELRLAGGGQAN